uniref:Phosphoinositol transporter putative n=1 Tax=Albugo laibachii Nc14 TaxID=890382 RepID=F0WDD0_9STRA|nr:phosphoinositol transporter putative [Albugo laibachii Nc14]|eukprot:CCA19202.1 phosphoinositol transporter putative [Albugo laibachii Nc14]
MTKPMLFLNAFKSSSMSSDIDSNDANNSNGRTPRSLARRRSRVGKQLMRELRGFARLNGDNSHTDSTSPRSTHPTFARHLSAPSASITSSLQPPTSSRNGHRSTTQSINEGGSPSRRSDLMQKKTSSAIHSLQHGCATLAATVAGRRLMNGSTLSAGAPVEMNPFIYEEMTPLDTISNDAPPTVAIRYGHRIRLYGKSSYVSSSSENKGGYVGTFEIARRFLHPMKETQRHDKQNGYVLACLPPIQEAGSNLYKPSTFRIVSIAGLEDGTALSYGDVFILVDDDGKVWNNKIGVGPTTLNGHFGPKGPNFAGEMYLSFYQLGKSTSLRYADEEEEHEMDIDLRPGMVPTTNVEEGGLLETTVSDFSSDEEEGFLSLASLARNTKMIAENTFGVGRSAAGEAALASALASSGKVVFYGDRNVIIDIADSNRMRSKFNQVITHYRKYNEGMVVQGGYLRCDGRGKLSLFELHGLPLPSIAKIHIIDSNSPKEIIKDSRPSIGSTTTSTTNKDLMLRLDAGLPIPINNVTPSSLLALYFSDESMTLIPCSRFSPSNEKPFYIVVRGSTRPYRLQVQAKRSFDKSNSRCLGSSLFEKCHLPLCMLVVAGFYVIVVFNLPWTKALFLGSTAVSLIIGSRMIQIFKKKASASASVENDALKEGAMNPEQNGENWLFSIIAWEASTSERTELKTQNGQNELYNTQVSAPLVKIPASFLIAESENVSKAMERYQATLQWRVEMNVDKILETPHPKYYLIKSFYKQYIHKRDKLGHPIYFEKLATINMKALQKAAVSLDDLFYHYLFNIEFTVKYVASDTCACQACCASKTRKLLIVLDARGIGMKDMSGEFLEFVRKGAGMMQRHYPQRSYKILIINVPSWFGMVWKGVKGLLNEATRQKTNILSETEAPTALLQLIDKENLPVEYGGQCQCSGGCESNSAFMQLQKSLVDSVLASKPFCPDVIMGGLTIELEDDEEKDARKDSECTKQNPTRHSVQSNTAALFIRQSMSSKRVLHDMKESMVLNSDQVKSNAFPQEVLKAGFLLKRSVKRKHFIPIWYRRVFVLHGTPFLLGSPYTLSECCGSLLILAHSIRFSRSIDSELYSVLALTGDTVVRKTQKQNNHTFELITPLMEAHGRALLLYAPTSDLVDSWVEVISSAIAKLRTDRTDLLPPKDTATVSKTC